MILSARKTVAIATIIAIVRPSAMICIELVPGSRVRVLSDKVSFQEAFLRFRNDEVNGLSPAKLEQLGQEADIINTFSDGTATCEFALGVQHDMPVEVLEYVGQTGILNVEPPGDDYDQCRMMDNGWVLACMLHHVCVHLPACPPLVCVCMGVCVDACVGACIGMFV